MKLEFGFGSGIQAVELPEENLLGVLTANAVEYDLTGEAEVERALAEPNLADYAGTVKETLCGWCAKAGYHAGFCTWFTSSSYAGGNAASGR